MEETSRPLLAASLSVAMVKNDDAGNVRLVKKWSHNQSRDDVAAAGRQTPAQNEPGSLFTHGMPFDHETVKHSISEYVNGMAHTNGIESPSGLYAQAWVPRHLPPHEREAPRALYQRVFRAAQRPRARHT